MENDDDSLISPVIIPPTANDLAVEAAEDQADKFELGTFTSLRFVFALLPPESIPSAQI